MPKKRANSEHPTTPGATKPSISAEAALSFLKDTKGVVTWSVRDLADTLKISRRDAEQVIALLAAQGYVQPEENGEWMTQHRSAKGLSTEGCARAAIVTANSFRIEITAAFTFATNSCRKAICASGRGTPKPALDK